MSDAGCLPLNERSAFDGPDQFALSKDMIEEQYGTVWWPEEIVTRSVQ